MFAVRVTNVRTPTERAREIKDATTEAAVEAYETGESIRGRSEVPVKPKARPAPARPTPPKDIARKRRGIVERPAAR
jgi:hypothetical protein